MRRILKRFIERSILLSGTARYARRRRSHDVFVLAYHNVVPDGAQTAGDGSLHLPQRVFARQLDLLQQTHNVVSLREVMDMPHAAGHRPRAVITFDDAYQGAVTAGVAELRRRGLPATIFVAPHYVGGHTFWWDLLTPPSGDTLDPAIRHAALTTYAGQQTRIIAHAIGSGQTLAVLPANAQGATITELEAALEHPGVSYGSHTWSHPNLTQLAEDDLAAELRTSREWLGRFGDRTVSAISYPYGCANEMVWRAAEHAGYAAGLMIDGGWMTVTHDAPYAMPRLNIPAGVSSDGFTLRVAGIIAA